MKIATVIVINPFYPLLEATRRGFNLLLLMLKIAVLLILVTNEDEFRIVD